MSALAFVVMALAVARVSRAITTDEVSDGFREAVAVRFTDEDGAIRWPVILVNCDWCIGWWLALVAAVVGKFTHMVPTWEWAGWCWPGMACAAGLTLRWQ